MNKIIYFLLLLPLALDAQININRGWKDAINRTFQHIDKTKIQSGILLDYGMEFTNVAAYNGVLTDSAYINANVLGF